VKAFVNLITNTFPKVELIAGVATGGIPLGVLIADRLKLPFIYVRQAPKEHGLMKQVEGYFHPGSKTIVIEDHISTGGSSFNAIQGLRKAQLELLGLISLMTYRFEAATNLFKQENINYYSMCDLDAVIEVALNDGMINSHEKAEILEFRNSPKSWAGEL
jgi:orotate phosphoribosyltransferase